MPLLLKPPVPDLSFDPDHPRPASSWALYRMFNIGNSAPTFLLNYINKLENPLGITAIKQYFPI